MTPILYEGNEVNFTTNGLGRLADAITCKVVEERNGMYELEMKYPITGIHYSDIQENRIILAQPHDGGLTEPFVIYKISRPLDGIITINAEHISYRLTRMVVSPFTAGSIQEAFSNLPNNVTPTCPFTFTTDLTVTGGYSIDTPRSVRGMLSGEEGSILDVYGHGDYEFSRWNVILRQNRGSDNSVTLRYGKNITALNNTLDMTEVYTGICPFWTNGETTVMLPEKVVLSNHVSDYPYQIIKTVDFSSDYEDAPSVAQLRAKAQSYVANNEGWKLRNNITVSFVQLWNTEEYKNIAALERVNMCDVVHVVYSKLGVDFTTQVVRTDYDVLQERYNSITLGNTYYTLNNFFDEEIASSEEAQTSHMQKAIARATKLIQGGLGGHVVFNTNADGEPQEILIMDTDDVSTAVNVIRMNLNGIGFSTSGYNGPFTTAWTIDGHFVADFIDTGTLTANIIKSGVLQDEGGNTTFNLATGALSSKNLTIDSTYFKLKNDGEITSMTADGRKLVMNMGKITGYKTNGTQSAALEIGDGYFNIIGKLALNGVVGVSGSTSFVKGISYENASLGNVVTGSSGLSFGDLTDVSLNSSTSYHTVNFTVTGNVPSGGGYVSLSGSASVPDTTYSIQKSTATHQVISSVSTTNINYAKAVTASTGSINSADGLIQSIS